MTFIYLSIDFAPGLSSSILNFWSSPQPTLPKIPIPPRSTSLKCMQGQPGVRGKNTLQTPNLKHTPQTSSYLYSTPPFFL